jgi:arginine decarboxylase
MNTPAKLLPVNHAWKIEDSLDLYQVEAWGKGYFSINAAGHVVIRPSMDPAAKSICTKWCRASRRATCTLRWSSASPTFSRIACATSPTPSARPSRKTSYKNRYAAVFPIKVNQQRLVVEEVYRYGKEFGFGLEVGSKPELLAVMSITEDAPDRIVVCNGFKDDSYIEAVILATKLGRTIIPVVENYEEIHLILKHAERYGVRPKIGVRVKLASEGAGRWRESAGEKSKFGLFISEILDLYALLKERNMLDCLQLVHCHPGSQLQDIRRVKDAINELAHVYAELKIMGAGLQYIDIGGGLGVDYDGSGTNYESSMNYTLNEYASDVVYRIKSVCDARDVPHPMIVSESGRAIAAHHSLLVFDTWAPPSSISSRCPAAPKRIITAGGTAAAGARFVRQLPIGQRAPPGRVLSRCAAGPRAGAADVQPGLSEPRVSRSGGKAVLGDLHQDPRLLPQARSVPEELENLEDMLSDIYFCNFSVFQSLPDSWAIGQLFPIMPISVWRRAPTRNAVLADITCDSDGKIDRFVHPRITKRTLKCMSWSRRALLPGGLPGGRLPGDPGGPAQPVRRHPCGPHPPAGRRRLVDRGNRQRRYRQQGARVHGIRHRRAVSRHRPGLRAGDPGRPDDADRGPGGEALLRKRTQRLRLPRGRVAAGPRGVTLVFAGVCQQ